MGACLSRISVNNNVPTDNISSTVYVSGSGSITSVGTERANLSAVVYLLLCSFCLERFPLPLGAWDGLRYFIVAPLEPSM